MLVKPFGIKTIIIGIAFVAGIVTGTLSFHSATASNTKPVPVYEKNESGETYGSGLKAISPETEPVLMNAIGEDGNEGYIRTADLRESKPKTLEEAAAREKKINTEGGRKIPLYAVDGKTVIGVFKIDAGKVVKIVK